VDDVDALVGEHRLEGLVRLGQVVGARLGGGALRAGADDAGHLDPEPPQRLDVDEADETGADDRCSDVPE
jgi:hypothetical protein